MIQLLNGLCAGGMSQSDYLENVIFFNWTIIWSEVMPVR